MAGLPRQFMGNHPLWGETKRTRGKDGEILSTSRGVPWKQSPYYWWWYALRLNETYKKVCEKGSTSNRKLNKLYKDFGNIHEHDFKTWWRRSGAELFGEPPAPIRVTSVKSDKLTDYAEAIDSGQAVMIAIPLWLTRREITSSVKKVVASAHDGHRGRPSIKYRQNKSQAKYQLSHYRDIYSVQQAILAAEGRRQGKLLKSIANDYEPLSNVSRRVRDGETIIKATADGVFPLRRPPTSKS